MDSTSRRIVSASPFPTRLDQYKEIFLQQIDETKCTVRILETQNGTNFNLQAAAMPYDLKSHLKSFTSSPAISSGRNESVPLEITDLKRYWIRWKRQESISAVSRALLVFLIR